MDKYNIQFIGSPCGEHGAYTFYKGFKYCKDGIWKVLNLGEFFYVRTSRTAPISIAELQLLWADRGNGGQLLSSCRLYYLPDNIPNGRTQFHGQDEVVANHNKVVLKLHDLLQWVCDDIIWPNGTEAISNIQQHSKAEDTSHIDNCSNALWISNGLNIKELEKSRREIESPETQERPRVHIVSYPNYCRYKAVLKRIENTPGRMLTDAYVTVLGGIVTPYRNTKLLFCRDTTDIPSLINHNKICDELAPNLKGRPRKKRSLQKGSSVDEDYEPVGNCSSSSKENDDNDKAELVPLYKERNKSLLKGKESRIRPKVKITPRLNKMNEEARFLESLRQFMEVEKRPIDRIPHLGFKQIDLFIFFNEVKKVGGYDAVCDQRKWKQIYDQLGGSPGSTSAATCTRRHYEKLLLSYEKNLKGEKVITPPVTKVKKITCSKDVPQPVVPSQAQSKEQNKEQSKEQTKHQSKDQSLKPAMKMLLQKPRARVKKPRAKMLKDHVREMEERKRLESLKAQQLGALQNGEAMTKNDMSVLQIKNDGQPLAITPIQAGIHHPTNPALALAAASSTDNINSTLPLASYPILKCVNPASIFATIKHDGQPMAATVHTIPNPGIQFVNAFHPAQIKEEPKAEKANTLATTSGQLQSLPPTSRASVIQHTHSSEADLITNKPGMVQPCDLILRQKTDTQRKVEKESKEITASAPEDTIIITPRFVQPFFSNLGYIPQMMLSNQLALMRNNCPQLLQTPYMKSPQFNQRVDTSKKRQGHKLNGSVSNSMYSTPEQEEPCDLSLPKKRRVSHHADTKFLKSTNHLSHHATGHRQSESGNRSKHGKSGDRYFHKNASHLSKVKMTPDTRGSITQGVINSKKKPTVPNSQVSPLKGSKAESSRFTLPQVPAMTFNPIPGILEGAQTNQLVFPDIKPPLLTAACPTILSPRFISAPLLSPQLLQVPHDQAAAFPDFIRQRMFLPPFTSAGLVTPTRVSSDAKHSPVYRA